MPITFATHNVAMPDIDQQLLRRWIAAVAESYGRRVGTINYLFADDEEVLRVNRQFLDHDFYTDIITFDNDQADIIQGDIIISLDTVRSNAEALSQDYRRELHRVIIHGILHLCGEEDKGPGQRQLMEAAEDRALALLTS